MPTGVQSEHFSIALESFCSHDRRAYGLGRQPVLVLPVSRAASPAWDLVLGRTALGERLFSTGLPPRETLTFISMSYIWALVSWAGGNVPTDSCTLSPLRLECYLSIASDFNRPFQYPHSTVLTQGFRWLTASTRTATAHCMLYADAILCYGQSIGGVIPAAPRSNAFKSHSFCPSSS